MDNKVVIASFVGGIVGGFAALGLYCLSTHKGKKKEIQRFGTNDPRASRIVVHDGKVYLSGQVGIIEKLDGSDITEQTRQTLTKIDDCLASVGTNKSNILEARIWLRNISEDFKQMNEVWNAWVDQESKGTRYCVGAELARPTILVEIQVTATLT